jgi:signal transduction histidine kinase
METVIRRAIPAAHRRRIRKNLIPRRYVRHGPMSSSHGLKVRYTWGIRCRRRPGPWSEPGLPDVDRRLDSVPALRGGSLRPILFDLMVSCLVVVLALADTRTPRDGWWPGWWLPVCGAALALMCRRNRPETTFASIVILAGIPIMTSLARGIQDPHTLTAPAMDLAVLVALYSTVKYAPHARSGWLATGVTLLGTVLGILAFDQSRSQLGSLTLEATVACLGVWLLGAHSRSRRLLLEGLRERSAAAERERVHLAQLAVATERASIARELHDIVAHSLSVMIVQADGARYTLDRDSERARQAVDTVANTGRDALDEMRRLVAVLRSGETAGTSAHPFARLGELDGLIDRARAAGLTVRIARDGVSPPLPAGIELTLYRIVQESITNVIKHAGPGATIDIQFSYTPAAAEIHVLDDGGPTVSGDDAPADSMPCGGNGLIGLRERVAMYDGCLLAGPRPDGGWFVNARIPVPLFAASG